MPQLSLYIDEHTLQRLRTAARLEHLSLSRYVVKKLNESMNASWPEGYERLFGAIDDDSFVVRRPTDFAHDTAREGL